MTKLAQRYSRL